MDDETVKKMKAIPIRIIMDEEELKTTAYEVFFIWTAAHCYAGHFLSFLTTPF